MRALIAARKSNKVDGGREGHSLHTQDELSREFCERMGWQVAGVAADTISGRVAPVDRKNLGKWLAEPWQFDCVVAYKTDRLSRGEQEDWTRIEHWATEHGKQLVIVDSGTGVRYPARDDSDYWQWTAAKREAGREWQAIRERAIRNQDSLMAKGSIVQSAPFGYRIDGSLYDKRFCIVESEAVIVREAFRMITNGDSLRTVAAYLSRETGRQWRPQSVSAMINNWTYAGRIESKGVHYANCDPIVSTGELTRAQQALKSRNRKARGGRPSLAPALMVPVCGECGSKMYRSGGSTADHDGYARAYRYYCSGSHKFGMPVEQADDAVIRMLTSSTEPEMRISVIPGHDYADEIETARRDRLQALERDDIAEVVRLTDAMKELESREKEPDHTERVPTGRTVGQRFAAMSRDEIRAELRSWTVTAYPDGKIRAASPWKELNDDGE